MKYQFSFSDKHELIFIDEAPLGSKIGSLIQSVIDTDWSRVGKKIGRLQDEAFWGDEEGIFLLKKHLSTMIEHPALVYHLARSVSREGFYSRLDEIEGAKNTALLILETLVDEERSTYSEILFDLLYLKDKGVLSQNITQAEDAYLMLVTERVLPAYAAAKNFQFLFETTDIRTILFQEIQYLCNNDFIIRKCAHCKKLFWTRRLNNVYCNRKVPSTNKHCSDVGPVLQYKEKRPAAYKKYWSRRSMLYNHQVTAEDKVNYQCWLKETEPYRELAKRDAISEEDMVAVMKKIEAEIYSAPDEK